MTIESTNPGLALFGDVITDDSHPLHRLALSVNGMSLVNAVITSAEVFHRLDPADKHPLTDWFRNNMRIDPRAFIEQMRRWIDVAIKDGELSLDDLEHGEAISRFMVNYSKISTNIKPSK